MLAAVGIKHGDTLYIGNSEVVMTSVIEQQKMDAAKQERIQADEAKEADKKKEEENVKPAEKLVEAKEEKGEARHQAFDEMILDSTKKCAKVHPPS